MKANQAHTWRTPRPHKPLLGYSVEPYPATRFFDQLSFLGNPNVGCFLLETSHGLILIDCMEPCDEHNQIIERGIRDLGLDPVDLKAILITHGHGDHYGTANRFRDRYGCKIYMSKVDYEFARQDTTGPMGNLTWEVDGYIEDGDIFRLGETEVYAFSTPGHTPGCLSYVIPVTDEGRPHMAALWGGTGIPYSETARIQYLESCVRFARIGEKLQVDAAISTHPFVDKGIERLNVIRDIPDGVPNPFVMGRKGYRQYESMFLEMCLSTMKQRARQIDELLPPPRRSPKK